MRVRMFVFVAIARLTTVSVNCTHARLGSHSDVLTVASPVTHTQLRVHTGDVLRKAVIIKAFCQLCGGIPISSCAIGQATLAREGLRWNVLCTLAITELDL